MRPDSITLAIFEKYSPEELATTAQQMANAQSEMEAAEAEKKVSDGVFNERIKKHAAEVSELAQRYNKGGETAQIGCSIHYDIPEVGKKSYIRMDTEQVVEVHDMSWEEKQETLQFPLTSAASEEAKPADEPKEPKVPKVEPAPEPEPEPARAITFKEFQRIAVHLAKVEIENRLSAIQQMVATIAPQMLAQKSVIGPDGRMEPIESAEIAEKLANTWLELAVEQELKPPAAEEVTRLCPYPGCILFAEHDGMHEFPPTEAKPADSAVEPEPQPQKERKSKPRRRPPADPPQQPGAPA